MPLLSLFMLVAHYFGLMWYLVAIRPLEIEPAFDDDRDWFWLEQHNVSASYILGVRYVCSLYWALSVMTNLKGVGAHETRQCLYQDPHVVNPLEERALTIAVFVFLAFLRTFTFSRRSTWRVAV